MIWGVVGEMGGKWGGGQMTFKHSSCNIDCVQISEHDSEAENQIKPGVIPNE